MSARVLKWSVPVDDDWHAIGGGQVLHVGNQGAHGTVCVWTLEHDAEPTLSRNVLVTGTGQPLPDHGDDPPLRHIGSTLAGPFVWHVFEATL